MSKDLLLKAIKAGMQGEMDSITHYQKAAMDSDGEVRAFFDARILEEKLHFNYLLQYYREIENNHNLSDLTIELSKNELNSPVISRDFINRIGQNQILFSAISTALLLEKNGIDFYKKSALETNEPELVKFFLELARWEEQHYTDLVNIQKEAEEYYWQINSFEPF